MNWLQTLIHGETIAHDIFLLSIVAALGLALGRLKIKGIGLGIAGVLFPASSSAISAFAFRLPSWSSPASSASSSSSIQ